MKLELQRPLAIIDLETTGVNVSTDRIVEIAMVKSRLMVPGRSNANSSIQKC